MYKLGLGVGITIMACSLVCLVRSKRSKGDIIAGVCMVAIIAIAAGELI